MVAVMMTCHVVWLSLLEDVTSRTSLGSKPRDARTERIMEVVTSEELLHRMSKRNSALRRDSGMAAMVEVTISAWPRVSVPSRECPPVEMKSSRSACWVGFLWG